jgi:outer membrane protein
MLFDGFQTFNAVRGAEALVEAGREDLRSTEQQVLLDSTTAFMDVVRDQALLELQQNNVKVLNEQLRATNDRFQVGEVTKTDVAQARAAVSAADSAVSAARANLQLSRANFQRLIGHTPVGLKSPSPASKLIPAKMEQAISLGEAQNPTVLASLFRERSSIHDVKQIKGELLPRVTLQGRYTKGYDTSSTTVEVDDTTVTADVTVPLYQAGEVSARIRQAQEVRSQRLQQIDEAREQVRSNVISAWGQWTSTKAQIESDQAQVESNRIALEGVREEERVGQRTVLDVLNAEQAYLNAQVALVTSRRDHVVASYQLLTAIGRLSAYDIALKTEMYDPAAYYSEVRDKRYGWHTTVEPEDPEVGPVLDPGLAPGQDPKHGPAYTHKPGCAEARRESCR